MLNKIDSVLNKITMYRVVLYYLLMLVGVAIIFGAFGLLPYSPVQILISTVIIVTLCWAFNTIFAWVFDVQTNVESLYITAFILVLLITPMKNIVDSAFFEIAFWASAWAMAAKYIFAIKNKHVFNPAAIAVVITALFFSNSASWWVGTAALAPFALVGGYLVARKILRMDLVVSFFVTAIITIAWSHYTGNLSFITVTFKSLVYSPIIFFAFAMLTEPLTTPPTRTLRVIYGAFVGFLFAPNIHIGSVYSTPELALVVGNLLSYILSPKEKLVLVLKEKIKVATDTYHFAFNKSQPFSFVPGQYLEWTLGHEPVDSRGNRRYFTIASSPTENEVSMGVKFYPNSSTFKTKLLSLEKGDKIVASQRAGDFTLPKDKNKKLVFIAGGIGITPFRSMMKYLVDKNEKRDIALFYSNRTINDIAYTEIFDEAYEKLGTKIIYTITDPIPAGQNWLGKTGFVNAKMIAESAPDYKERVFYISGPHGMVVATQKTLSDMGIKNSQIKQDFFPGFV